MRLIYDLTEIILFSSSCAQPSEPKRVEFKPAASRTGILSAALVTRDGSILPSTLDLESTCLTGDVTSL